MTQRSISFHSKSFPSDGLPWRELRYALWVPGWLACFALLESMPIRTYWATQTALDRFIPFCAWFVIPYLLWYGYLAAVGLILLLGDAPAFVRYMRFLSILFFVSAALWIFFPNGQDLRPTEPDGVLGPVAAWIYRMDTCTNVFPSGHTAGCVAAVLAARDARWPRPGRLAVAVLSAVIMASTLLIKQHSVLDMLGALALSVPAAAWVYGGLPEAVLSLCRKTALRTAGKCGKLSL